MGSPPHFWGGLLMRRWEFQSAHKTTLHCEDGMYSFATVSKYGDVTRVLQETHNAYQCDNVNRVATCYYVNSDGHVEFDGSAHTFSAEWLVESIWRWTNNGDTIIAWSHP